MAKAGRKVPTQTHHDDRKARIYIQDCAFYRHTEKQRWSRIQAAGIIEGGLILARFSTLSGRPSEHYIPFLAGPLLMLSLISVTAIVILILFSMSLKYRSDARRFLKRIREYEGDLSLGDEEKPILSVSTLNSAAIVVISLVNVLVIISLRQ